MCQEKNKWLGIGGAFCCKSDPDIERLFAAFKSKKADRVPNFEVLVEKLPGR